MRLLGYPGPADPPAEQVRRWVEEPVRFWEECARLHGPMVSLDLGSLGPAVLVSDPEAIREIFQLPSDSFECRQYNEHYRHVMGDHSILLQDGPAHDRERKVLGSNLRHADILPHTGIIRRLGRELAASWPEGEPFQPRPRFHDLAFQVVLHLALGSLGSPTARALHARYRESVLPQIGRSWGPWQQFHRMQDGIRTLLVEEMAARRADASLPGILTNLVWTRDDHGGELASDQIVDHIFTLMIAGVDTTSCALAWCLYWLTREPAVREQLVEELGEGPDDVADAEGPNASGALLQLPYLHAVFQETLRMVPVVPTPSGRKLTRDTVLAGRAVPAGVTLLPCTYLLHRRESVFSESDRFRPERFLERRYQSHEYFPFGGGTRRCLGEQLSQVDFKIALAAVLRRWSITARTEGEVVPVRHGILLAPSANFRVLAFPRKKPPEVRPR